MHSTALPSQAQSAGQWGRAWTTTWFTFLSSLALVTTTPFMVFYFYIAVVHYDGALSTPLLGLWNGTLTWQALARQLPPFEWSAVGIYAVWFALQVLLAVGIPDLLHKVLPNYRGGRQQGAVTPAGNELWYEINGLQAWFLSHALFIGCAFYLGAFSPAIIAEHWGSLLWVVNIMGNAVALFVYLKAMYFPTDARDCKWSNSRIYAFYMGLEFNPRIGQRFDFKLFFNGRPGIIAWTLINLSFAAYQYQSIGYVTNSMILVNILHAMYVLDFFWNETWYLRTIDICHDHFGWMLAWGDCVWLPYMYTLQCFYLAYHPVDLPLWHATLVAGLGLSGYLLFRSVNAQKDYFRRTDGKAKIWGKIPSYVSASYTASNGTTRQSKLLTSGWWGMSRHMNYTGDLMGSLAYCMACGFGHVLPYFYIVFMTILLIHRCIRDEQRCKHKYGASWDQYCQQVRYRLIPGVF
ncbi:MAG: hypothetical protein KDK78_09920 [Chlamydiia bacterium]|nr:hypothetical protein [Chlamydiia bacterium]